MKIYAASRLPPRLRDEADATRWIQYQGSRARAGESVFLAIVPHELDRPVGSVNILRVEHKDAGAELGYWLESKARGRGLATAALRCLSRACFSEFGLQRLELYVTPDNMASRRVAEQAGYKLEGLLRSYRAVEDTRLHLLLYSFLPEDVGADPAEKK
jgi:RimJ/RimL family protein N-acetyltransferase